MFGAPVLQNFDSTYLRLDATNSPLTGALTTQAILPDGDSTRDLGSASAKFRRAFGSIGVFVNGGSNFTFPTNASHGGMIGGSQNGPGTNLHVLSGNNFPAVACIGNTATTGAGGTAVMRAGRGGAVAFGSAYAYTNGNATVEATGYAATVIGYAYGNGTSILQATASGSVAFGYANGRSATGTAHIISSGSGSFTTGLARVQSGGGLAHIISTNSGSFASGYARSDGGFNAVVEANGVGSFAVGGARANSVLSRVFASANGALALGFAQDTTIEATAINAAQFGPGINALADSLQVGSAGIRFKGTPGAPGTPQNGDFWRAGNFVYVRSNNTSIQIAGPGPLTN